MVLLPRLVLADAALALAVSTSMVSASWGARPRPHVSAGFGCKMGQQNVSEFIDYRWDVLDSVHYHDAVGIFANGSTYTNFHGCDYPRGAQFRALRARAQASGVAVWLSTGNVGFGSFGTDSSQQILDFFTDEQVRWRAIKSSLDAVEAGGLAGLSVDFEGNWRFNSSVRAAHSRFFSDLAAAGRQRTPPIPIRYPIFWDIYKDSAVDMVALTNATESTVLMTYDYHWGGDGRAGPNAPLVGCGAACSGDSRGANVMRSITEARQLSKHPGASASAGAGASSAPFLLGIAWYGLEYPTQGPDLYSLTNYSRGPKRNYQVGGGGPHCGESSHAGSECRAQRYGKLWDNATQTPWYRYQDSFGMWQQGYYDDDRSVKMKYGLSLLPDAEAGSVQGLFIWPLNGNSVSTAPWAWEALVQSVGVRPDAALDS
jgi:hypothetical protein